MATHLAVDVSLANSVKTLPKVTQLCSAVLLEETCFYTEKKIRKITKKFIKFGYYFSTMKLHMSTNNNNNIFHPKMAVAKSEPLKSTFSIRSLLGKKF